jgi:hypothetical protein
MRTISLLTVLSLAALSACGDPYPPTLNPDYTIRVMNTPDGMVAIPPTCPDNVNYVTDPYDNQPMPQFGCASARNLAMMTERPEDLVHPRELGPTPGTPMVGAIFRYNNNQTRSLIYLQASPTDAVDITTMSTATSAITGDVTSGLSGSSSGSSSGNSSGNTSTGTATGTSTGGLSSGSAP